MTIRTAFQLALLYNLTSVYTNIPCCRRDESKREYFTELTITSVFYELNMATMVNHLVA